MINIQKLYKQYGTQILFEDASFNLGSGERVGLMGRNGHGKSTLFQIIIGENEPDEGVVSIPKHYRIGHLEQHLQFEGATILEEACRALPQHHDGVDESYKAKQILSGLGFSEADFEKSPSLFSGGFQVRLSLAKVLIQQPDLLLLDEPTNYLDIVSVRWLRHFLTRWPGEMIIITHDRGFMDSVSTHTLMILHRQFRKLPGSTTKMLTRIAEDEAVRERQQANESRKRKETESFINRFRASANKAALVQSRIKALARNEPIEGTVKDADLDFKFAAAPMPAKDIMHVEGVSFGYDGGPELFTDVSFAVKKRDRIAVIGKNGKGKSTLLNVIVGALTPTDGLIRRHDRLTVGYLGQTNVDRLDPSKRVLDAIADALPRYDIGVARKICGLMMFSGDQALKRVSVISGGERMRVMLGIIIATPCNLLLLDEPNNHLDMTSIDALVLAVEAFEGAVMLVSHHEQLLAAMAKRLVVFDENKVSVFEGHYGAFLETIGFSGEDEDVARASSTGSGKKNRDSGKGNSKKERRVRAAKTAERARILGPLKKEQQRLEDEILNLEALIEEADATLVVAANEGNAEVMRELPQRIETQRNQVTVLMAELDRVLLTLSQHEKTEA